MTRRQEMKSIFRDVDHLRLYVVRVRDKSHFGHPNSPKHKE